MWHSLYFISYAAITTISAIIIAWGQYARYKSEKIPFNFTLLWVLVGISLAMWTGAGLVVFAYEPKPGTAAFAAFFLGISLSTFVAWQVNKTVHNILADKKELAELATRDSLTGMLNRRVFQEVLKREFVRAVAFNQPLSLAIFEIDGLSQINERYGYKGGDMVLREIGARFSGNSPLRPIDPSFRFRNNRFALIFPKMDDTEAHTLAKKVHSFLAAAPFDIGTGTPLSVTFSMGVASFSQPVDMEDYLIQGGLRALEAANENGGNCVYAFIKEGECRRV